MPQKLLKARKRKVAGPRPGSAGAALEGGAGAARAPQIVLVATYRERQLAWIKAHGVYNYPVREGDEFTPEAFAAIRELWLYADAKGTRHCFAAALVGRMTRAEFLSANPTYAKLGGSRANTDYYVFRVTPLDYGPQLEDPEVLVRAADFATGRAKAVKGQIDAYHASGDLGSLADWLPSELTRVPANRLRVCEAAVQLDFWSKMLWASRPFAKNEDAFDQICKTLGCDHGTPGWPDGFGEALKRYFAREGIPSVRTLSLFSGAGGLDIGFSDVGFDIVDSVEIEEKFCKTLELNSGTGKRFSQSTVNCMDIRQFSGENLGRIDFIIGGPPCQTFSAAGRRANGVLGTTDARGVLFREYVRLLGELKPRGFLFENVYGITGAQGGSAWREIQSSFAAAGYKIFSRILDAADYGVPQHRERLFIVGVRDGEYRFPRPTHGPDSLAAAPFYDAGTAVSGLSLSEQERKTGLGGRFGRLLDDIPPGLNYSFYTKEMGHPNPVFAWRSKFSDFLYKADPKAPVRTIKAQGGAYTGPLHWDNRFFACAEYKRLQTFPDDYEISGGKQVAVKQIGNSVPPQIARILALSIQEQIFKARFPFRMGYLSESDQLTFRSRKLETTERYRSAAREIIEKLRPSSPSSDARKNAEFYCRMSRRFKFERCSREDAEYRVRVTWNEDLEIDVYKMGCDQQQASETIEIGPRATTWEIPARKVVARVYSSDATAFTVAWKAFERVVAESNIKADLVQLNGYYQYAPALICGCTFAAPFEYGTVVSRVVAGNCVGRIVGGDELASTWGVAEADIVPIALKLRSLGYEIRNTKTNPQIAAGHWLIPYAFPTLNHMSVQLNKEIA